MEYLSSVMLLCIVVFNIAIFLICCFLNTGSAKHFEDKNMIATVIVLAINLILNVAFMICFVMIDMVENVKIFVLFLPLTGWFLYETIKEARRK